jgi:rubrerythrin
MASCNHVWTRPLRDIDPNQYHVLKCIKCGLNAKEYKCPICNDYTPHVFVKTIKEADSIEFPDPGELESWKCLECGHLKTVRVGGRYARVR